jgi:hypothetical protein
LAIERKQCEFFLVRYVSDPVKNEFVNIGLLLRDSARMNPSSGAGTLVRFTRDWGRVRCLDPDADLLFLDSLETELRQQLGAIDGRKPIVDWLRDSQSNNLQITEGKACLAENLPAEMDKLMGLYVEPRKREAVSRKGGRQAIYGAMRTQFERAGVWDLMRKRIAAAEYTRTGDPLRIDCGYRSNGIVRMFHAVSLEGDLDTAKVLAFSIQAIRDGIQRVEQAELELTAIVQPLGAWTGKAGRTTEGEIDGDRVAQYRFAVETMEREDIRVLTTGDLPRIGETARRELRV